MGAFCRHTHAEMEGAAEGPLAGLTFGVKDIYDIAGHKTGFGSPDWLRSHGAAARTAPVVRRLLDAGAAMVGKTHTDELTYSLNGENAHYGTPVNVNAPGRIPGGSSSGSAAAVAGGLCDFALGSDTGGSVRAPASFCGIFGMRPTHGRVSLEGACPLAPSFDTCGWFTRSAEALERVGRVLLGEERGGTPRRLLLAQDAFALAGDAVSRALDLAVGRISALLGKPEPVAVAADGLPQWFQVFRVLQGAEAWAQHGEWVTRVKPELGPGIRQRVQWAADLDPGLVGPAKMRREEIARHMEGLLAGGVVLVLPTVPGIAPVRNSPPAETEDFRSRALSLLCIAGLARLPQASLPLASLDGCPLGLSLIAARGSDAMLLGLARRLMI
ncbi:MAG: amidase [Betaproteobacteria bacterium]|nr:amidase [Betaproteobacteria bacterium]MBI2508684.1 amidase [Betaproteobacteria bacterium]